MAFINEMKVNVVRRRRRRPDETFVYPAEKSAQKEAEEHEGNCKEQP